MNAVWHSSACRCHQVPRLHQLLLLVRRLVLQGAATGLQDPLINALFPSMFCLQALSSTTPEVAAAAHQALAQCEVLLPPRAASHAPAPQLLSASMAHNPKEVSSVANALLVRAWCVFGHKASCWPTSRQ